MRNEISFNNPIFKIDILRPYNLGNMSKTL